jgi:hypothetical protein
MILKRKEKKEKLNLKIERREERTTERERRVVEVVVLVCAYARARDSLSFCGRFFRFSTEKPLSASAGEKALASERSEPGFPVFSVVITRRLLVTIATMYLLRASGSWILALCVDSAIGL